MGVTSKTLHRTMAVAAPVALCALYFLFDPMRVNWMPRCVFYAITGYKCPGCGTQRMAHALLHGDFAAAWQANPFLLLMIPPLSFLIWLEFNRTRHPRLYARIYSVAFMISVTLLLCAWWVLRNIFDL